MARLISIRQTAKEFQVRGRSAQQKPGDPPDGYGSISTAAAAVVHAANMGATVINLSIETCWPNLAIDNAAMASALRYAANQRNVVVIAAAGNNDSEKCKPGNPNLIDPMHPDKNPWTNVKTYVSPAMYSQYALTVGSVDNNGNPSPFTVPGPWVGVAAPGQSIVSVDPRGDGLTKLKSVTDPKDNHVSTEPLAGTSFAAPYVAGVAALVRSKFPYLSAQQVIERIERTAHAPGGGWNPYVGYGIVDPVAALTADLPANLAALDPLRPAITRPQSQQLPVPSPPAAVDNTPRNIALIASGSIALLLTLGMLAAAPIRKLLDR